MLMTKDEIKAEIAAGGIRAIALDTTIFEKSHNRFEHAPLSQLKQFLGSAVRFLISDVVAGEVRAHVIRDAKEAEASVRAAMREMGQKWQKNGYQAEITPKARLKTHCFPAAGERKGDVCCGHDCE